MLSAVDAKDAVKGVASKAAAGAQRMAGLEPKQGTHTHATLLLTFIFMHSAHIQPPAMGDWKWVVGQKMHPCMSLEWVFGKDNCRSIVFATHFQGPT